MGVDVNYRTINYSNQAEFDYFFATAFDRYDRNRDGVIDYNEMKLKKKKFKIIHIIKNIQILLKHNLSC